MENLKRLFKYLKPYKKKFIYAMVCMIFVAASQSALMLLTKPVMDKIFVSKQTKFILPLGIGMVLAGFLKFVFSYFQNYILSFIGQAVIRNIRNEMYEKLMNSSLAYFIKSQTGRLISRLTYDVSLIQQGIVMIPRNTFRDGLYIIFYIGVLFYLNWEWALAVFVAFPVMSIIILKIGKKIRRRSKRAQELTADIYSILQEKITGVKLIKSVVSEEKEIEEMKNQNQKYFEILMRLARADVLQAPLIEFVGVFSIAIVVIVGGYQVCTGTSTLGTLVAFIVTSMSMYKPAKSITDVNTDIQTALAATERIFEIIDEKPTVIELSNAEEMKGLAKEIKFENVNFSYDLQKPVLTDINFTIKKGEIAAIVGPSGSGKTTIINLLARFFDPTRGIISIDGNNIKNFTLKSLRCQMGIVTQETILFNDTVSNNISYGMQNASFTDIEMAAKKANAADFIEKLSQKYDTIIGERGVTLSGGERQRIAIARVILRNPQILILDEATSALDSESEMLVQDALSRVMEGKTTVVIAHRLSTVKSADKIIVIAQGKIVAIGTHSELIEKSTLYKQLYELQDIT